jgi:hypothetical protein
MSKVIDNSLVILALLVSAWYALAALGPKGLRMQMWNALAQLATRAPRFLRLARVARRLESAAGKTSGACGGCGSCGSDEAAAGKTPASEVRVSVEKIGRRP